jgi:Retinoic acid induced 16-like protein
MLLSMLYERVYLFILFVFLDVLGTLVKLSESDRPFGIQAEVLRSVQNMVVLLDEQFLVHSAVHKAILRLLRNCVGDDMQEQLDGRNKVMGAAGNAIQSSPSEYEEDREYPMKVSVVFFLFFDWDESLQLLIYCASYAVAYGLIGNY